MSMGYHGTKEDLFAAAASFDLRLPLLAEVDADEIGVRLVEHFLDRWEGVGSDGHLEMLLRASVTREAARCRLVAIFEEQLVASLRAVPGIDRVDDRPH